MRKSTKALFLDTEAVTDISMVVETIRNALGSCDVLKIKMPVSYRSTLDKILNFWTRYAVLGLRGFIQGNKYDIVIAWQQVVGLVFSFLKRLFFVGRPKIIILKFIYRKRKNRLNSLLRFTFTKFALEGADCAVCLSRKEVEYYSGLFGIQPDKFKFIDFSIELPNPSPRRVLKNQDEYIVSAGTSNRDYPTLFKAIEGVSKQLIVLAPRSSFPGDSLPENVKMFLTSPDQYLEFLRKALLVVVPLKDVDISSGLLVFLEAMALGKAVIVSETWGTADYVENMKTGILVKPGDAEDLRTAICYLLKNEDKREEIGRRAQTVVCARYTRKVFAKNLANLARQLVDESVDS